MHVFTIYCSDIQGLGKRNFTVPVCVKVRNTVGFKDFIGKLNHLFFVFHGNTKLPKKGRKNPLLKHNLSTKEQYYFAGNYTFSFASRMVTAWPWISTRSWLSFTFRRPVLFESCRDSMAVFPSFSAHKGVRAQWAEPVTGSSSMPEAGAKQRTTKSASYDTLRAVIINSPRPLLFKSSTLGRAPATSASLPARAIFQS